jgi:hypothetical protein
MNLRNVLLSLSAVALAGAAATAQIGFYVTTNGGGAYDRSIGNSYLGGGVHAHCWMQRTTHTALNYGRTSLDGSLRAYGRLLGTTGNVVDVWTNLANQNSFGVSTASGRFRIRVIGFDLVNRSFSANTSVQNSWSTMNVFGIAPRISIPVGPFSITLSGNLGAGMSVTANFTLSAGTASVGAYGVASAYGQARASVAVGIPYLCEGGVRLEGRIFDQSLVLFGNVSPTGFNMVSRYVLTPLVLRLVAWIDGACVLGFEQSTTLCSWSSSRIDMPLF